MSKLTFCSYCGRSPKGRWAEREHRVCRRCELGIVLRTDADLNTLRLSDRPFLIVDRELSVQAISRSAEAALNVDEADMVGCHFDEILTEGEARSDDSFEVRSAIDPGSRFSASVHSCGPPTAALVVLEDGPSACAEPHSITAHDRRARASYRRALLSA